MSTTTQNQMNALVYTAPNEMQVRSAPMPNASDLESVLRIEAVGICGSDMHAYHGHDPRRKPGLILGHEFAGTVVDGPGIGRRVTGNPLISCGRCEYCIQGRNNLCADRTMVGMTRAGAFAQYMSIPEKELIDIPDDMSATQAALTEPGATALHALAMGQRAMLRPLPEARVMVIGGGAIGMLSALLLRAYGAREVWVAETNDLRRDAVAKHAQARTFNPVNDAGPGESSCDLVIDAVGAAVTRKLMLTTVKPGAVAVHIGLQDWASEIDMRKLTLAEITLIGTYTYSTADLKATVAAIHDGKFGDLSWVEERPLSDGAQAFDDLHNQRTASAKLVLHPNP
ncbi:MAG: alcohol dehydrogenase catalytic domain-containing protein [Burkholderiaceae bacterium]